MDIWAIIGIVVGIGGMLAGNAYEGGHMDSLMQMGAFIIVFLGTAGATIASFPVSHCKLAITDLKLVFKPPKLDNETIVVTIVEMARVARKDGLLALEKNMATVENDFMKRYLQQIIDGLEADLVREGMEAEIDIFEEENSHGAEVLEAAGGYAPTIGIIGAVFGLIHTMQNLDDPSKLGTGIAVAFVATIYGLVLANILTIPMGTRIKKRVAEQVLGFSLIMEGLLALQAGHNPRVIEDKLRIYMGTHDNHKKPEEEEPG